MALITVYNGGPLSLGMLINGYHLDSVFKLGVLCLCSKDWSNNDLSHAVKEVFVLSINIQYIKYNTMTFYENHVSYKTG